jgi:5-methylcytosine-specific restriction protein A
MRIGHHSHRTVGRYAQPSPASRGYDRHHQRWRAMVLARCPYCRHCEIAGRVTIAIVADHIRPLRQGGDWAIENGQGLCLSCHARKTRKENKL